MRRLPTIRYGKKEYTIDPRLREFRFLKYGRNPEFIAFDSPKGHKIIRKLRRVV